MSHDHHISIAMCTYNGGRFLREQLDSIAKQTRLPDELVICDDGSSDSTPKIVEEFARSVSFHIGFKRNSENLGSTKNFEQAIRLCTGNLIALCDQDDIWRPEKLARQAEMMERDPSLGGVFSDAELIDERTQPIGGRLWASVRFAQTEQRQFTAGHGTSVLIKKNVVTGATLMFRADMRRFILPIPTSWVQDSWIAWMVAIHSKLAIICEPLISYRIHTNQQVGVEAITLSRQHTLLGRLKKARLEEPAKHLWNASELRKLEERLIELNEPPGQEFLITLRKKINFSLAQGNTTRGRMVRTGRILLNVRNYQRYGHGVRGLMWDIVILFV